MYNRFLLFIISFITIGVISLKTNHLFSNVEHSQQKNKQELKVLILVIASDQATIWHELQNSWRSYMHLDPEHIEVYFLKNDPNLDTVCKIDGDTIWSKGDENFIPGILDKTILSMELMLPRLHEFDYIVRTNVSSFYVFPRLLDCLKDLPKKECYGGYHDGYTWICGAGIIFSPDIIELLVQNKNIFLNTNIIDDVAMGHFLLNHGIKMFPINSMVIYSLDQWRTHRDNIPENIFHFRVKNHDGAVRLLEDLTIHKELVEMFYGRRVIYGIN